jgi:hypothetical protein
MAEDIKEYGAITLDIEDNIQENVNQKMTKIKFTTDPTDKLYLNEQPPPTYYLPFYIDIFQSNKKTIKDITSANVKLTDLFTKKFTDFITITLTQPLTAKTCVNFIKDKSLVQRFITEYKSKNPSIDSDKYNSYDISKYKTFIKNVYIFFIKILATDAGSFIYKYKDKSDTSSSSSSDTLETKNKKLYYVKLLESSRVSSNTNIYDSINNFIDQKKKPTEPTPGIQTKEEIKKRKDEERLKKERLYIDDHIYLSIIKNREYEALTKTILDNYFKSKEDKILKEKNYDFKSELDYNKKLKEIILDKLLKKKLYKENIYNSKLFTETVDNTEEDEEDTVADGKPILQQLIDSVKTSIDKLNALQKESAIIKNSSDIKNDILTSIKLFYVEKEKNIQKREKKIHINIKLIKGADSNLQDSNLTLVDLTRITYEGAPTFSDIEKFQKKLQEDISNYIKNCQNPKDIQSKVEKECTEICKQPSKTIKNKLWCNICTNYIKCVYDNPEYNPTAEIEENKRKKEEEEENKRKEEEEEKKRKEEEEEEKKRKEEEEEKKRKEEEENKRKEKAKKQQKKKDGSIKYFQKKTISKKQFKPIHNVSIKLS